MFKRTAQRMREALWGLDGTPAVTKAGGRYPPNNGPQKETRQSGAGRSERESRKHGKWNRRNRRSLPATNGRETDARSEAAQ